MTDPASLMLKDSKAVRPRRARQPAPAAKTTAVAPPARQPEPAPGRTPCPATCWAFSRPHRITRRTQALRQGDPRRRGRGTPAVSSATCSACWPRLHHCLATGQQYNEKSAFRATGPSTAPDISQLDTLNASDVVDARTVPQQRRDAGDNRSAEMSRQSKRLRAFAGAPARAGPQARARRGARRGGAQRSRLDYLLRINSAIDSIGVRRAAKLSRRCPRQADRRRL